MRVLFITRFNPERITGGVAEFLYFLPHTLKNFNVQAFLYSQAKHFTPEPLILKNQMRAYEGPFMTPGFFSSKKDLAGLLQICKSQQIDVVHAQELYRSGYLALQIKKQLSIPYVITSHSDVTPQNSKRMQRRNVRARCKEILTHANAVTHLTPNMAETSHAIFPTHDKSHVIANGIDLSEWQTPSFQEEDYMLAMGRLEFEKGFHVLINAYAKLREQNIQTSLVIAGCGNAEKELQAQARVLGLNVITEFSNFDNIPAASVIFTGYVRGNTKHKLLEKSKINLFATQLEEAFGIVQIEVMAAGKVMIASDIAATRYLQNLSAQSILVQANDVNAWASEISNLLKNKNVRDKLGKLNHENAKQFDWNLIASQYARVYAHCVMPAC